MPETGFSPAVLTPQINEPVRVTHERLKAKWEFSRTEREYHVVDFGQNLTGLVEMRIRGEKGQKMTIRHAETAGSERCILPGHPAYGKIRGYLYPKWRRSGADASLHLPWVPVFAVEGIEES